MTEPEYINRLTSLLREDGASSLQTIALADEAVRAFPRSARLWLIRGNFVLLSAGGCPPKLDLALDCYQRAVDIDPELAGAWEALGHLHHVVLNNEAAAKRFFSESERLRRITNEARIAGPLFSLVASGGTIERIVSELPAFKSQIEAAFDWMNANAKSSGADVTQLANRLRELILLKEDAIRNQDFALAADVRGEERALFKSVCLRTPTGAFDAASGQAIEGQIQRLSKMLGGLASHYD